MIARLARKVLVWCGLINRPDLVGTIVEDFPAPDELASGLLHVVQDGNRRKWACMPCPCGCGHRLQLSLSAASRPRWTVDLDWLERPTLHPSVRETDGCRAHFWVRQGRVEWCADTGIRTGART